MERLTKNDVKLGFVDSSTLPSYASLYERLREYEIAEEQGLLLRLKCKVGDMVWDSDYDRTYPYEITGYSFGTAEDYIDEPLKENEVIYYCRNSNGSITGSFAESEIGKTVFLTKEEAEKKLAEMKGE